MFLHPDHYHWARGIHVAGLTTVGGSGVYGHLPIVNCFGQTLNFKLHSLSNLKSPVESFFNCERGLSFPAPGPYGVLFCGGFDSGEDFVNDGGSYRIRSTKAKSSR